MALDYRVQDISIHPPRAGRDAFQARMRCRYTHFNPPAPCGAGPAFRSFSSSSAEISIHPPRAGRDPLATLQIRLLKRFQSTRPVRGGTPSPSSRYSHHDFNPPAPCGAGLAWIVIALLAVDFNPPAPCGAGPGCATRLTHKSGISIHPPRAGRDQILACSPALIADFNPPAPCGAGRWNSLSNCSALNFNPPAPCGAGHLGDIPPIQGVQISIHPPRAGRDNRPWPCCMRPGYFNPPAPCGAGPPGPVGCSRHGEISIHPPRAGRD